MKLYTEEQVNKAIYEARFTVNGDERYSKDEILDSLIPIELPSDEEIINEGLRQKALIFSFMDGAKWMKEQILNQNK